MTSIESLSQWQAPTFSELRMDAEVGSYQDEFDPARDVPAFVGAREESRD